MINFIVTTKNLSWYYHGVCMSSGV